MMNHQTDFSQAAAPVRAAGRSVIRDVLIVDDHPLMCEALSLTLGHLFSLRRVRQAASLAAAEASIRNEGAPDAVVLDLNLPDVDGMEGVLQLRARLGSVPLTVISAEIDRARVSAAMAAGACGFISKTLPRAELGDAFERMWSGEQVLPEGISPDQLEKEPPLARTFATLTPQQMRILRLLCEGRPNKVISWELSIAEATVKTHIAAIMNKINVSNRTQAALLASKAGLFAR